MQNLLKLLASTIGFNSTQGLTAGDVNSAIDEGYQKSAKLAGQNIFTGTTETTSSTTGDFQSRGGGAFTKSLYVGANLILPAYSSFRVSKNSTTQTQSTDNTVVTWATEEWDDGSVFAANTFTADATGTYSFSGLLTLVNNDATSRALGATIRINSVAKARLGQSLIPAATTQLFPFPAIILKLNVGDVVDIVGRNFGSGTSYTIGAASAAETNYFSGSRIR